MRRLLILPTAAVLLLVGCAANNTSKGNGSTKIAQSQSTAPGATLPATTAAATAVASVTTIVTTVATRTPATVPTPKPTPVAHQPLALQMSGFGQNGQQVGYAFIVNNPNTDLAVNLSQVQIAAYDASGTVLATENDFIQVVYPGERLGIGGMTYLQDKTQTVVRVTVQLDSGKIQASTAQNPFSVRKSAVQMTSYNESASGVVASTAPQDVKQVEVYTVAYDAAGAIIGGGFTFVDFVPAGGTAAAKMPITTATAPAKVEMFATSSSLSGT